MPAGASPLLASDPAWPAGFAMSLYGFQKRPPVTSSISTLYD